MSQRKRVVEPDNVYLCQADLDKIIGNIRNKPVDVNSCNNVFCLPDPTTGAKTTANTCECLFNRLIDTTHPMTCSELDVELENMLKKSPNDLPTQIKYNLQQLVNRKVKYAPIKVSSPFGTFDWWRDNVWGDNKMQNFIYIISFTIAIINILYLIPGINSRYDLNFMSILFMIAFVVVFLIVFLYYGFKKDTIYMQPTAGDPTVNKTYIETNSDKYGANVRKNMNGSESRLKWAIPLGLVGVIIAISVIAGGLHWVSNSPSNLEILLGELSIASLMGLVIIFNLYFAFLLPQLLIIASIIQLFFLSDVFKYDLIIKVILLIMILILTMGETFAYFNTRGVKLPTSCDGVSYTEDVRGYYVAPLWFIFATIIVIFFLGKIKTSDAGGMMLYLEPIVYRFNNFLTAKRR